MNWKFWQKKDDSGEYEKIIHDLNQSMHQAVGINQLGFQNPPLPNPTAAQFHAQMQAQNQAQSGFYGAGISSGLTMNGINQLSQAQMQAYQQQYNQQLNHIQGMQNVLGQQQVYVSQDRTYYIDGEMFTVHKDEYELILKHGHEALKKLKQYNKDFEDLING